MEISQKVHITGQGIESTRNRRSENPQLPDFEILTKCMDLAFLTLQNLDWWERPGHRKIMIPQSVKSIAYPDGSICSREARSTYPNLFEKRLDKSFIVTLLFSIPAAGFLVSRHAGTGVSAGPFFLGNLPALFPGGARPPLRRYAIFSRPSHKSTCFDRLSTCNQQPTTNNQRLPLSLS